MGWMKERCEKMMSHTPGPWKVAENLFGNTASYEVYANVETKSGKGGYTRICQITPRDQKANARLIAAAPEMLEALENCLGFVVAHPQLTEDLRNLIAKARGES
jgi:hypothetical protein